MKIKSKLIIAFLVISLTSLFVSNILSYYGEKKNLTRQILNHLESVASFQLSRIENIIIQNLERLVLVSSRTQLRISLEKYIADGNIVDQDKMNRILNDAESSINDFKNISIFALDGTIVASTDHDRIGTGHPEAPFFLRGLEKNSADLLFLDLNQDLQLRLTGPLYMNKKLLGVVVIESSVENMVSSINDYTGLGTTGETVLARHNENGDALFIMPTRINQNAALKLTVPKEQQESPTNLSLSKVHDILTDAVDYRGIQVFAATRYVEETDWGIVVKIDREEALAPIIQMRNLLAIIFLASAILIILVSVYIAKSITRPVTELTGVAQKISQGNLSVQADEKSIGEIGILAQVFNEMIRKLINAQTALENKIKELQVEVKERRLTEEKAHHLNEELEQKNRELDQIVYVTSHDLRSPLVNIGGYSKEITKSLEEVDSILRNAEDLTVAKEKVSLIVESDIAESEHYISKNIFKMENLLSGLLNLSRLGQQELQKEKLNMNKVISDIATSMTYQVNDIGAKLELSELPFCTGDEIQINQLFSNLIGNALKYLDSERSGVIRVSGRKERNHSVYCVEDNGIGIAPEHQEKIFEIFYQLNPSKEEGEGLGLSIASKIVNSHGGKIWVESEFGKGSKFFVSIPS